MLSKDKIQQLVEVALQLDTQGDINKLLAHNGLSIVDKRRVQTAINIAKGNAGTTSISTLLRIAGEAKELLNAIKMGEKEFSGLEIADFVATLKRHTKRIIRYVAIDKVAPQNEYDKLVNECLDITNTTLQEHMDQIQKDIAKKQN